MTTAEEPFDWKWRAGLLAKVMLTRSPDVVIVRQDGRWNVLAELLEGGASTGQLFAAEVGAALEPELLGRVRADGEVVLHEDWKQTVEGVAQRQRDTPFPVCFVAFEMARDRGCYGWIRRPVGDRLVTEHPEELRPLTDEAVDEIVRDVRTWYAQRSPRAAAG